MANTVSGFTVMLKDNITEGDAEKVKEAINLMKGVINVEFIVGDPILAIAKNRARYELLGEIQELVFKK